MLNVFFLKNSEKVVIFPKKNQALGHEKGKQFLDRFDKLIFSEYLSRMYRYIWTGRPQLLNESFVRTNLISDLHAGNRYYSPEIIYWIRELTDTLA